MNFLGIDVGTSGVKATIVDDEGIIKAYAFREQRIYGREGNKRELNPEETAEKILETIKEVVGKCCAERITLITIGGLGEAVVPIDKEGRILRNSIIGSDIRGSEELKWLRSRIGEEELVSITGLNLSSIYSLNKILYLKAHHSEIHQKTWKYLCFTDYVGYLLTGETKIDYSMASRTMAFDVRTMQWSAKIINAAGLSSELFSDPVEGGTVIGSLKHTIKNLLGITYDIPVMVGSHDHIFNALGAGAVLPGICSIATGTTEGITTVLRERIKKKHIISNNISCEPFVRKGLYNTVAWHNAAGAAVNWYLGVFHSETGKTREHLLKELNDKLDMHPGSLMVLPHFAGATAKYMDENAKAGILGLTLTTSREDIFKAIMEGTCYECRVLMDCMEEADIPLHKIIISGGGSKSAVWMQLKANIMGRTVYQAACADTGAVGGAMLGAVIMGRYPSLEEAAAHMVKTEKKVEPNMEYHKVYQERYVEYGQLYQKLINLNRGLQG